MELSADEIRALAAAAAAGGGAGTGLSALLYVGLAALSAFLGAMLGEYAKTRGKTLATRRDLEEIVAQLRETTRAAEDIKARVAGQSAAGSLIRQDQYRTAVALHERIVRVTTTLNRLRSGRPAPEGFLDGGDVVALTEVYEDLAIKRFLLGPGLHGSLSRQAGVALRMAQGMGDDTLWGAATAALSVEYDSFAETMRRTFDVAAITGATAT